MDKSLIKKTIPQKLSHLEGMAQHIKPAAAWVDLGLSTKIVSKLKEICSQFKQNSITPCRESASGKGLNVLFSGHARTSKIKAAEAVANELHLDLYRIDLSTIVSKHIEETEKNLKRLLDEAVATRTILLFDEADALFGKRAEVSDAHERYASTEVNYLLQSIAAYNGLAILASNSESNLDEAFMRRFHFIVEFMLQSD